MPETEGHHDWEKQRRETDWVWNDLKTKGVDFSRPYSLELQFVPGLRGCNPDDFVEALQEVGLEVRAYSDQRTIEAKAPAMVLTPESIWNLERETTEIALQHGYEPDGWGFLED